jgi:hypothetical protein
VQWLLQARNNIAAAVQMLAAKMTERVKLQPAAAAAAASSPSIKALLVIAYHGCALVQRKIVSWDAAQQAASRRRKRWQHAQLRILHMAVTKDSHHDQSLSHHAQQSKSTAA